jgi:hypothetical protein
MQNTNQQQANHHQRAVILIGDFLGMYGTHVLRTEVEKRNMRLYTVDYQPPTMRGLFSAEVRRMHITMLTDKIMRAANKVGVTRPSVIADGFACWTMCQILTSDNHVLVDKLILHRSLAREDVRWSEANLNGVPRVLKVLNLLDSDTAYALPVRLLRLAGLGDSGRNGFMNHSYGAPHGTMRPFVESVISHELVANQLYVHGQYKGWADVLADWSMPHDNIPLFAQAVDDATHAFFQGAQLNREKVTRHWFVPDLGHNRLKSFSSPAVDRNFSLPEWGRLQGFVGEPSNDPRGIFQSFAKKRPVAIRMVEISDDALPEQRAFISVPLVHPVDRRSLGVLSLSGDQENFAHMNDGELIGRMVGWSASVGAIFGANPSGT